MKDAAIQLQVKLTSTAKDFLKLTNKPKMVFTTNGFLTAVSFLLFGTILLKLQYRYTNKMILLEEQSSVYWFLFCHS